MKLSYDPTVDALFVRFSEAPTLESEEIKPGIILDFDAEGHIVGIEILDVKNQLPASVIAELQAAE
jgi:uncharacterized protein YuzE